jgi:hypothetical protein
MSQQALIFDIGSWAQRLRPEHGASSDIDSAAAVIELLARRRNPEDTL